MIMVIMMLNNKHEQVINRLYTFVHAYICLIIEEPLVFSRRPESTQVPIGSHAIFYCSSTSNLIIWSKVYYSIVIIKSENKYFILVE
jgi:hypothetical protein